jgi:hypothetical protein
MKARITVEAGFLRALDKLPPDRAKAAQDSLVKFMNEPALPRLDFRPLRSRQGYFLIDGKRGDRIILRRLAEGHFAAVDVGPHDNIYRRWNR